MTTRALWELDAAGNAVRLVEWEEPTLPGMPEAVDPRTLAPGMVGRAHPVTSRDAAALVAPRTGTQRWRILQAFLHLAPGGLTSEQVEARTGLPANSVRPRLLELREDERMGGWLVDSGETRPTKSGAQAIVWQLAPGAAGRLRELLRG